MINDFQSHLTGSAFKILLHLWSSYFLSQEDQAKHERARSSHQKIEDEMDAWRSNLMKHKKMVKMLVFVIFICAQFFYHEFEC